MLNDEFLQSLLGLAQEAGEKLIAEAGAVVRLMGKDGDGMMGDMMMHGNRIDLEVDGGKIVAARKS